jgi:hypothetical protein
VQCGTIEDWENYAMMKPNRLLLLITVMILPACEAAAQTLARPCVAESAKLREDVQKCRLAAKAAGQRKASSEELCKHITALSAAELKWIKYAETNAATCHFPAEVVEQLKQIHDKTEQIKERMGALTLETEPEPCPSPRLHIADPDYRRTLPHNNAGNSWRHGIEPLPRF